MDRIYLTCLRGISNRSNWVLMYATYITNYTTEPNCTCCTLMEFFFDMWLYIVGEKSNKIRLRHVQTLEKAVTFLFASWLGGTKRYGLTHSEENFNVVDFYDPHLAVSGTVSNKAKCIQGNITQLVMNVSDLCLVKALPIVHHTSLRRPWKYIVWTPQESR
jgi:hypothetical protein